MKNTSFFTYCIIVHVLKSNESNFNQIIQKEFDSFDLALMVLIEFGKNRTIYKAEILVSDKIHPEKTYLFEINNSDIQEYIQD